MAKRPDRSVIYAEPSFEPERKMMEVTHATTNITNAFATTSNWLSAIAVGNTSSTRVGNKIVLTGICIRGVLANDTLPCVVRHILHFWNLTAAPTSTTLLASAGLYAGHNMDYKNSMTILKDKFYGLSRNVSDATGATTKYIPFKIFKFFKGGIPIHYQAGVAMPGLYYSTYGTTAATHPTSMFVMGMYFYDS